MHISDALAELNAGRYADFFDQPERPAIYAFSGDVYVGFEAGTLPPESIRSEEHTSELQSIMRISYAVFSLKHKNHKNISRQTITTDTCNNTTRTRDTKQ